MVVEASNNVNSWLKFVTQMSGWVFDRPGRIFRYDAVGKTDF